MKMNKKVVYAVSMILAFLLIYKMTEKSPPPPKPQPAPVKAGQAETGDFPVWFSSIGTIKAVATVAVTSQVAGELMSQGIDDGARVNKGDLIAQIDPRPFQAALEQAQGQLVRDEASLLNARQNLDRAKQLEPLDAIAPQDFDAAVALVKQYEGAVLSDRGQLAEAALNLAYSRITAPIAGRAGILPVDPGNIVAVGDAVALLTQTKPIDMMFTVTEEQLEALGNKTGQPVEAFDRTGKKLLATGKLLAIDNQIDLATGTVQLKAEFANADDALFPNQFVNARIRVDTLKNVVFVPAEAVSQSDKGSYVYVVLPDDSAQYRPVEIARSDSEKAVVSKGLQAGERVVVDGFDRLRDKSPVKIMEDGKERSKN